MNEVYSYMYSLAVAASAAGIVTALAPEGGQLKKYVKYAAALCVIVMLALPAKSAITEIAEGFGQALNALEYKTDNGDTMANASELVITQTKINLEANLCALFAAKLNCSIEDVSVFVTLDTSNPNYIFVEKIKAGAPEKYKSVGTEIWFAEQTGCAAGKVVVEWNSSES